MSDLTDTDLKCKSNKPTQNNADIIPEKPDPSIAHKLYEDATQKEAMSVKKRHQGVKHGKKGK